MHMISALFSVSWSKFLGERRLNEETSCGSWVCGNGGLGIRLSVVRWSRHCCYLMCLIWLWIWQDRAIAMVATAFSLHLGISVSTMQSRYTGPYWICRTGRHCHGTNWLSQCTNCLYGSVVVMPFAKDLKLVPMPVLELQEFASCCNVTHSPYASI